MGIKDLSTDELKLRWAILFKIINSSLDDPRLPEPMRQIETIEDELRARGEEFECARAALNIPKPESIVINCKPAELFKQNQ